MAVMDIKLTGMETQVKIHTTWSIQAWYEYFMQIIN